MATGVASGCQHSGERGREEEKELGYRMKKRARGEGEDVMR